MLYMCQALHGSRVAVDVATFVVVLCNVCFEWRLTFTFMWYVFDEFSTAFLAQCTEEAKAAGLKGPQAEVKTMIPRLIRAGRSALCLQSYYTAGPKEVRAWTIMKGCLAPQAAGVIHSDFERGFIKAEVANFDDFKELHQGQASMAKVKEAGKYRQEGKLYAFQEGDIVVFMHNTTTAKKNFEVIQ
jgi:ribosome-binding ATPase YchF (GTP1/OBG family)